MFDFKQISPSSLFWLILKAESFVLYTLFNIWFWIGEPPLNFGKSDEWNWIHKKFEKIFSEIFLDQNITVVEKLILNLWDDFIDKSSITKIDSKTQLQEHSLKKYKSLPVYKINKQSGPQHSPVFNVEVQIKNSKKYFASGTSKKDAQQNAAEKLLIDLKI